MNYIEYAVANSWPARYRGGGGIHTGLKYISFLLETNKIVTSIHSKIKEWTEITGGYDNEGRLTQEHMELLKDNIMIWDDRIKNELVATPAICLYTEGILNYRRLQGGAGKFFEKETWVRLSDTAREDLDDAAKCLLCKLPTPAAMISLRAVEDVLRRYYKYKTKQNYDRKRWSDILNELLSKNKEGVHKYKVNKELLLLLDYIREAERNAAEHPDKRFEQEEAERMFSEVVKTIIEIYKDMPEVKKDAVEETEN